MLNNTGEIPGDTRNGFRQLLLDAVAQHNILPLTSSCNLRCLFCSHLQMPPGLDVYSFPSLADTELQNLIPYLDSKAKIIIGESSTRLCEGEPFTHPAIIPLLSSLRERFPTTPLQITTNGTLLTLDTVTALRKLGGTTAQGEPLLELVISLNCSKPASRREILGDGKPQRAIDGLQYCYDYSIPFHGSVVALPHLTGWGDLERTVRLLDQKGARTIRIFLPGTTRFAPAKESGDGPKWEQIVAFMQQIKQNIRCPLLLEPPLKNDLVARVEGVLPQTPAQQAGLLEKDIIIAVDGESVCSGVMAFSKIKNASHPLLTVLRNDNNNNMELSLRLNKGGGVSPGLVMAYDLNEEIIGAVSEEIERYKARQPLLLTSFLAAPLWEEARLSGLIPAQTLVSSVPNRFFGGTICCAGLLTVSDLQEHLSALLKKKKWDLLLIPAAPFDRGGRDLRGESYLELFQFFPNHNIVVLPR